MGSPWIGAVPYGSRRLSFPVSMARILCGQTCVAMKFAADRSLGRLAKWLRVLGFDTLYVNHMDDDAFVALAERGRILLSRNTRLMGKVASHHIVFVEDNDPKKQLRQILSVLDFKPRRSRFFARCILCNGVVEYVDKAAVCERVPDHVWTVQERFSTCTRCNKVYWSGTHLTQCRKDIEAVLQESERVERPPASNPENEH